MSINNIFLGGEDVIIITLFFSISLFWDMNTKGDSQWTVAWLHMNHQVLFSPVTVTPRSNLLPVVFNLITLYFIYILVFTSSTKSR